MLFDVFKGEQMRGQEEPGYRLTYQAERTLTTEEVAKVREAIIQR